MADCSTTGTALDQAARLIVGNNQYGGTTGASNTTTMGNPMMVANMLEQATMVLLSSSSQRNVSSEHQHRQQMLSIPLASSNTITTEPEFLPSPQLLQLQEAAKQQQQLTAAQAISNNTTINADHMLQSSPQNFIVRPESSVGNYSFQIQQPPPHYGFMPQQQMQQQSTILMIQQQHQLQLRQQQIMWMQQQQQQQQQQRLEAPTTATKSMANEEMLQPGHEGIVQPASIAELSNAWANVMQEKSLEDDVATTLHSNQEYDFDNLGANFDELASAWQKAQIELQNEIDDLTNMWTGENLEASTYHFQNNMNDLVNDNTAESTSKDWMEEGYREFNAGNMKTAIQAFEMELQQMDMDNATAWCMLGKCHAENDMDALAIQCFEEAVNRDPYSMESVLSLGVSNVNELNHVSALRNLKEWILHNPKFANLDVNGNNDLYAPSSTISSTSTEAAFDEVQRLLLSALDFQMQHNRNDHNTTASVLEALGVVYNVSRDYDAAIDVLQQSCALRPHDYQLWNKLGATLANSGTDRSEEALSAYHQALQIKPKYARAWLNMAIAHSNLQQYDDAARCYLQTLSINPNAIHCWSFLRIALNCIERDDLIPAATAQNLDAFKGHFDFVTYNDSL